MSTTTTRDWASTFGRWAQPPSRSEEERCKNAENMVRNAVKASLKLQARQVEVFTHGSYANNTNVRTDSDVDVAVACKDFYFYDTPPGASGADYGITPYTSYGYSEFKSDLEQALRSYFRDGTVTRGNKAIDIKASSYHVEADVTPFVDYRQYFSRTNWRDGYVLFPDSGGRIENYPHQHRQNGVQKNQNTSRRFKRVARVLKGVCYEMASKGYPHAAATPGFLLECLAGLTPDHRYRSGDLTQNVADVVTWLYEAMDPANDCSKWTELNGIKYLFHSSQPWKKPDARGFMVELWNYVDF